MTSKQSSPNPGKNNKGRKKSQKKQHNDGSKSEKVAYFKHIGPHAAGQSLLEFLCSRFTYFQAEQWTQLIQAGDVELNDERTNGKTTLKAGDKVTYKAMTRAEPPVPTLIPTLYEDEDLLIVNKPAHIPVHPTGRYLRNTLIRILQKQRGSSNIYLAHRLDRETSGVYVLTKSHLAKEKMYWQFFNNKIEKTYWALVWGEPSPRSGTVDAPLGPAQGPGSQATSRIRIKQAVNGSGAKQAKTKYHTLSTQWNLAPHWMPPEWPQMLKMKEQTAREEAAWPISLVEAKPVTGRTNQIRVHLAHVGAGLVGDKLYDPDEETFLKFKDLNKGEAGSSGPFLQLDEELEKRLVLPAHALHARKIRFRHPRTQEWLEITAPAPSGWSGLYTTPSGQENSSFRPKSGAKPQKASSRGAPNRRPRSPNARQKPARKNGRRR